MIRAVRPTPIVSSAPDAAGFLPFPSLLTASEVFAEIVSVLGCKLTDNKMCYWPRCNTRYMPDMIFVIGGQEFVMTPMDYVLRADSDVCCS